MAETTRQARQDVAQARAGLSTEMDELELAVRSAIDIPAKIRRSPVRVAALAGGAVFLAAGGPKRAVRRFAGLVRRRKAAPPASLLPEDVERIVDQLGSEGGDIRATLERGFAEWLEENRSGATGGAKKGVRRTGPETFWHLFDTVTAPLASRAAKRAAERLFAAEPGRARAGSEADRTT
ncbi:MAG: hypothetical protein ACP5VP_08060 [Candidatus Limnocylindrales bacterium]